MVFKKELFPTRNAGVNQLVKPKRLPEQSCLAQVLLNRKLLKHNLYLMEPLQQPEEILEIELFAIEEKSLPRAKRYIVRVDNEKVTVHHPEITGAEILALVNKTPEKFKLYEHRRHHQSTDVPGI
jgi:hypothetical protein